MSKTYDAVFKQVIARHAPDWAAWLAPRFGAPPGVPEAVDADLSTVQAAPDKVFRLAGGGGLLHLEVQSSHDGELADRMLLYNVLLQHRHGGPVHSTVILLRPEANASNLTGVVSRRRADGREYHRFEYEVVRVWQLSADALLAGGLGTAPLALLTDDAGPRLPDVVDRLTARADREIAGEGDRATFLTSCLLMTGLRYDRDVMERLFTRVDYMKESSAYQIILDEGRKEGLTKGREEGLMKGQLVGLRIALVAILESKFASIPPQIEQRINACMDAEKLQAAVVLVVTAPTLAEFERDLQL